MGRVVIANILGARGPQGALGPQGPIGPTGAKGDQGVPGKDASLNTQPHSDCSIGWDSRWSGGGSASTAYSYPTGLNPGIAATFVRKTWTAGGGSTNGDTGFDDHFGSSPLWGNNRVVPGANYLGNAWLRPSVGDKFGRVSVYWLDQNGTFLSRTDGSSIALALNDWTQVSLVVTAPASAANAWMVPDIDAQGALWATGDTLDMAGPSFKLMGPTGGLADGSDLGTSDLNSITSPGIYRQSSGAQATSGRNYPIANGGILTVKRMNGPGYLIQEYAPLFGGAPSTGVVFRREMATPDWSPWQPHVSSKWDGSRGAVLSDLTAPSTWTNLAYGSNWHDLDANTWDHGSYRKDATGHVRFTGLIQPTNAIAPSDPNASNPNRWIGNLPVGFRPAKSMIFLCAAADSWCNVRFYSHAGDGYNPGDLIFWDQAASSNWVSLANISYYAP